MKESSGEVKKTPTASMRRVTASLRELSLLRSEGLCAYPAQFKQVQQIKKTPHERTLDFGGLFSQELVGQTSGPA